MTHPPGITDSDLTEGESLLSSKMRGELPVGGTNALVNVVHSDTSPEMLIQTRLNPPADEEMGVQTAGSSQHAANSTEPPADSIQSTQPPASTAAEPNVPPSAANPPNSISQPPAQSEMAAMMAMMRQMNGQSAAAHLEGKAAMQQLQLQMDRFSSRLGQIESAGPQASMPLIQSVPLAPAAVAVQPAADLSNQGDVQMSDPGQPSNSAAELSWGAPVPNSTQILTAAQRRENAAAMVDLAVAVHTATAVEAEGIELATEAARQALQAANARRLQLPEYHLSNAQNAIFSLPHLPAALSEMDVLDGQANISAQANVNLLGSNDSQVGAGFQAASIQINGSTAPQLRAQHVGGPVAHGMHTPVTNSAVVNTPANPPPSFRPPVNRIHSSVAVQAALWASNSPACNTPMFTRFPLNFLVPATLFSPIQTVFCPPPAIQAVSCPAPVIQKVSCPPPATPAVDLTLDVEFDPQASGSDGTSKANAKALPQPPFWDSDKLSTLPSPKIWFKMMNDYVEVNNLSLINHFSHFLSGKALLWFDELVAEFKKKRMMLTTLIIKNEFLSFYKTSLKDDEVVARDFLHSGAVSMSKHPKFNDFVVVFKTTVRKADSIGMQDQIYWFLKGLTPDLHTMSRVQPSTHLEWSNIDELITFVRGNLLRINDNTANHALFPAHFAP